MHSEKTWSHKWLRFISSIIIQTSLCQSIITFPSEINEEPSCESLNAPGKTYAIDIESGRCHILGTRGPCNEMMTFYRHPIKPYQYGFCDCTQAYFNKNLPCASKAIRRRIYFPNHGRCYTAFSQGPCNKGQWFLYDETRRTGLCTENQCAQHHSYRDTDDNFWFYEPKRKQCYRSYSRGYCEKGMHLELVHDSAIPQCKKPTCMGSLVRSITATCRPGTRYSYFTRSWRRMFGFGIKIRKNK